MSDNKPKSPEGGGTEGSKVDPGPKPPVPKPADPGSDNAQLKARVEQLHSALEERDAIIEAQKQRITALQGELAETRRGSAAPNTLTPLEGLPRGALRLLSSTVIIDEKGSRVYAKRGDVIVPAGAEKMLKAARRAVGSRARVFGCQEEQGLQLLESAIAEQA